MVTRKLITSNVFKGKINKMSRKALVNFLLSGVAFGIGLMKFYDAAESMTVVENMKCLGDIDLPEEVINDYERKESK